RTATWLRSASASGPGWMAAGDAVCALDPSWGRGVLFALLIGAQAGRASANCVREVRRATKIEQAFSLAVVAASLREIRTLASISGSWAQKALSPALVDRRRDHHAGHLWLKTACVEPSAFDARLDHLFFDP